MTRTAANLRPAPPLVLERLAQRYGFPQHGNPRDVFFCAVYVLLSAQTTLEQAQTALRELRRRWPSATALANARPAAIRGVVNSCGFGTQRSSRIHALARAVAARPLNLRTLRALNDDDLERYLTALPGIGFKTARVVAAMSSLQRTRFAIDIHTWRIASRLGWVHGVRLDRKPTLAQADGLEKRIEPGVRRQLHACLVALGRDCCKPQSAECGACVISDLCKLGARAQPPIRTAALRTLPRPPMTAEELGALRR